MLSFVSFHIRSVSFCYKRTMAEEINQQKSLVYVIAVLDTPLRAFQRLC